MVDGAALLMAPFFAARASGFWRDERGTNMLDSGAYFYDAYECADGRYVAVGAIEPQFHAALLEGLGLAGADDLPDQMDRDALAGHEGAPGRPLPRPHPRRLGRPRSPARMPAWRPS